MRLVARPGVRRHGHRRVLRVVVMSLLSSPLTSHALLAQGVVVSAAPALGESPWTLERVVTRALSQHPLLEAARAHVGAARGEMVTASALPNPVATFWMENAGFPGQELQVPLNREASTYVTWPLEPLLQRSTRIRRADEDIKVAESSLKLARRQVAADAARAFFHVALAQALAEEAEENRDRLDQLASYNRARVDEGLTAESELLRIQVEHDRAATEVAFANVSLARARGELAPYVGTVENERAGLTFVRVDVPNTIAPMPSSLPSLDWVFARARNERPELVASRARVAAAAAAIDVERTLSIRQWGATLGSKRVEGQNSMVLGVNLAVPLFNRNRGGVARATSEQLAAEHQLAWSERTIAADVASAYDAATQLTRQLGELQDSFLKRAEEVHNLTLGAYQEGGATLLQVLDATRLLADARLTYSRALFAQRESVFDLALAAGAEPADAVSLLPAWSPAPSMNSREGVAP